MRDHSLHGAGPARFYQAGSSEMLRAAPAPQTERTPSLLAPSAGSGFTAREFSPAGQVDLMGSEDLIGTTTPIASAALCDQASSAKSIPLGMIATGLARPKPGSLQIPARWWHVCMRDGRPLKQRPESSFPPARESECRRGQHATRRNDK